MLKILSDGFWIRVAAVAKKAQFRQAAIAYVTSDLIGFQPSDLLITDASPHAIACGDTSAKVLQTLASRNVLLYSCPGLHAKVLLLGDIAVIGSGNMSASSADVLVEAGIMTNSTIAASGIASFIEQLKQQSDELTPKQ